jgi:hypothetical protein
MRTRNSRLIGVGVNPNASPLDGVIAYLTRKHGGNVHDQGIAKSTFSEPYDGQPDYAATNAADLTADSYFNSKTLRINGFVMISVIHESNRLFIQFDLSTMVARTIVIRSRWD